MDRLDDRLHGRLLVGARCISLGGYVMAAVAAAVAVGSGMAAVVAAAVAAGSEAGCAVEVAERTFGDRCWRTAVGGEGEGMNHD